MILNKYFKFYASWSLNIHGYDLSTTKEVEDADVIIIHWINFHTLSISSIEKILKTKKPVYWFMHDMWPITGGCHHAFECQKLNHHCHQCVMYNNRTGSRHYKDLSYWQFKRKIDIFDKYPNLKFITPSNWLFEIVKKSRLGKGHEVIIARNILNLNLFKPRKKEESRQRLGLPFDRKLILFGADFIQSPYKGWVYLKSAIERLPSNCTCVVYGNSNPDDFKGLSVNIIEMGNIKNINKLIDLYSACDLYVSPSLADNYPNVLIEAMSCGLVCVGFKTGGIPDIIQDRYNGLIIANNDSELLLNGILEILTCDNYDYLSQNAIRSVQENNSYSNIIQIPTNQTLSNEISCNTSYCS